MLRNLLDWLIILGAFCASAYYLNWVAYVPAASQDGSLSAVFSLGVKWYGLPLAMVIQLMIWWAMPRLWRNCPSPWIAALVWPLISAVCKVIILWPMKRPQRGDWFAMVGMFVAIVAAWLNV